VKRTIARVLLWFAVIWWGVWFGGQMFNALMVVPHFSANAPQSLAEWGELRSDSLADFFLIFNSLWIAVALGVSLVLGWHSHGRSRNWVLGSLFASLVSAVMVAVWMAPAFAGIVSARDPTVSLLEVQRSLHQWTVVNWGRLVMEFDGFVCALLALTSPQVTETHESNRGAVDATRPPGVQSEP
jgi:hypothetical protein